MISDNNQVVNNIFPGSPSFLSTTEKIYGWGNIDNTSIYKPTIIEFNEIAIRNSLISNYSSFNFSDSVNLSNPILDGYVFEGWYMDEALTIPFNISYMPANDVILYAKFTLEAG